MEDKEEEALQALEAEEQGITKVNWGDDGSILLREEDFD
jgi:hypothetical protein